jgi:tRNA pseudouridine55 synthase
VIKESGPTSHDVVDKARRALKERRIGHTGTLDPMAEGVLLLCIGHATRLQQYLLGWPKTYNGIVRLGFATTTYDREGEEIEPRGEAPTIDLELLSDLERRFTGTFDQVPPPYSAKKVDGKKLYELARNGQTVEIEPKSVTVHGLNLRSERPSEIDLTVETSTGFYVRSLAHDIGVLLGCGGYLHHLCRLAIGPYNLENALPQKVLETTKDPMEIIDSDAWIPLDKAQLPFSDLTVNATAADRFTHGQEVVVFRSGSETVEIDEHVTVRAPDGALIGIGTVMAVLARGRTLTIQPAMVFADDAAHGRRR